MTADNSTSASTKRWWWIGSVVAVAFIFAVVAIVAAGSHDHRSSASTGGGATSAIRITNQLCGVGWTAPSTGDRSYTISNQSSAPFEVELESAGLPPDRVFGSIEVLAPGTTRTIQVRLSRGPYVWRCTEPNGDSVVSAVRTANGPAISGRSYIPVSNTQLLAAIITFQTQTANAIKPLVADTDRLDAAVDGSQPLATVEADWLTAHLDYERLGGAYDLFGDYDGEINGRADGLPRGVRDPDWTGFRRLEYGLWHGQSIASLRKLTDQLDHFVHAMQSSFPLPGTPPNDLTIRVHEILENALQFEMTGQTDEGSHTNLATVRANVDGTRMALSTVAPLLATRDPRVLSEGRRDLDNLARLLDAYHAPDGSWVPVQSLTLAQRQRLDAAVDQAVEDLSVIPDVLELDKSGDD